MCALGGTCVDSPLVSSAAFSRRISLLGRAPEMAADAKPGSDGGSEDGVALLAKLRPEDVSFFNETRRKKEQVRERGC